MIEAVWRWLLVGSLSAIVLSHVARTAASPKVPHQHSPQSAATIQRAVALTFDDGPSPYTPRILDVLRAFHAQATFFVIGREVVQYPALVRAVVRAGDEIGNHTYTHADLLYLSNQSIRLQLTETQDAVETAAGVRPRWFHPPDGAMDARVAAVAISLGLRPILWSVDPRDWSRPGTGAIVERVLTAIRLGGVVLLHDGGGDRSQTLAALPVILRVLKGKGYRFLTLSAIFNTASAALCNETAAARWFAAAGVAPIPGHAIYQFWIESYCRGTNFGPATSGEYGFTPMVVAEDFVNTAHRLEWDRNTGSVHARLMWSWAARVFAARGIQPRWHTAITHAWFDAYFHGHDWGPALAGHSFRNGAETQCFLRGSAVARGGRVTWTA